MKTLFVAASIVTLSLAVAAPAMAESADASTCRALSQQVGAALSASDNADARAEQRAGLAACNAGLYANGAAHYHKALSIVGK
jgi:hypothetical protein